MLLGRRRVRFRQPHVQRDDAGFHAEADQEEEEQRVSPGTGTASPLRMTASDIEPDAEASTKKPAAIAPVPTCDMTRYRKAARRALRASWSDATSAAVARVITSHANRKPNRVIGHEDGLHRRQKHVERDADQRRARRRHGVRQIVDAVNGHGSDE